MPRQKEAETGRNPALSVLSTACESESRAGNGERESGRTIYANKIIFHAFGELFLNRLIYGFILGWLLIPWALLKSLFGRR